MPRTQKTHPRSLKAKVAVEAIKAHKTTTPIAQMFGRASDPGRRLEEAGLCRIVDIFRQRREQIRQQADTGMRPEPPIQARNGWRPSGCLITRRPPSKRSGIHLKIVSAGGEGCQGATRRGPELARSRLIRRLKGAARQHFACQIRASMKNGLEHHISMLAARGAVNFGTALVVDDDEGVRRLVMITLQRAGWHVLGAHDGQEGCRIFDELGSGIHFVLTDILMPKMNGLKMLEHMRQVNPSIKGMLMSGFIDDDLTTTANKHGYNLLRKPFMPADLLAEVNRIAGAAERADKSP